MQVTKFNKCEEHYAIQSKNVDKAGKKVELLVQYEDVYVQPKVQSCLII